MNRIEVKGLSFDPPVPNMRIVTTTTSNEKTIKSPVELDIVGILKSHKIGDHTRKKSFVNATINTLINASSRVKKYDVDLRR